MDANMLWSRVDSPGALHSSNYLFLDLPGKLASENPPSTIPYYLCYNTLKPDIVILTDSLLCVCF